MNLRALVAAPDDVGGAGTVRAGRAAAAPSPACAGPDARSGAISGAAPDATPSAPSLTGMAEARAVARISSDYLLRTVQLLMESHGGNLLDALIFQAICQANVGHLQGLETLRSPEPPADDQRRPVSILAIANGLGLPFETTRRHVNRMMADGRCRRETGGVIVPAAALASPRATAAAEKNLANIKRCLRELAKAGVALG